MYKDNCTPGKGDHMTNIYIYWLVSNLQFIYFEWYAIGVLNMMHK